MFHKFIMLVIPFLMIFGFVRIAFGNEQFLMEWNDVLAETSKAPDIPAMYEIDIERTQDILEQIEEHRSLTETMWEDWLVDKEKNEDDKEWYDALLEALTTTLKGVSSIFTILADSVIYVGYTIWLISSVIIMLLDTISIPFRYLYWVFTSYILVPVE